MSDAVRWPIVILCTLVVIGLMAYARGPQHHHGNEVGSHGTRIVVVVVPPQ
jgi:hypothetical protein